MNPERHIGIVTQKTGENSYTILIQPEGACNKCRMKKICGQGSVEKTALSMIDLQKGDRVSFYYKSHARLFASFLVYILPLISLVTALLVFSLIFPDNTGLQALAGIGGLFLGWFTIGILSRHRQKSFYPVIDSVISQNNKKFDR